MAAKNDVNKLKEQFEHCVRTKNVEERNELLEKLYKERRPYWYNDKDREGYYTVYYT